MNGVMKNLSVPNWFGCAGDIACDQGERRRFDYGVTYGIGLGWLKDGTVNNGVWDTGIIDAGLRDACRRWNVNRTGRIGIGLWDAC